MTALPKTMKAAVLHGAEDVRLEEIPLPRIGPGDALVRIGAALTCGTDAKVYRRGGHPTMIKPPAPFGHEFAGTVAAVGPEVAGFQPGDRVVAANSAPCGECRYCKMGRESLCRDIQYINGAYAEYIAVPQRIVRRNMHPVSGRLSFQHAALVEPLACVLHGVEECPIRLGDTVAVNGAGPIGLFFVKLCKLRGARVIAVDIQDDRLAAARRLGADELVNATGSVDSVENVRALTTDREGVDIAVDATGSEKVWEAAIRMTRKGGVANLFGGCRPGATITIDTTLLHYSEITIKGVYHHTPYHVARALAMLEAGVMQADEFITAEFPLERVGEALQLILNQKGVKSAVLPGASDERSR
jgi:L-iditol 2-dehydrogenase